MTKNNLVILKKETLKRFNKLVNAGMVRKGSINSIENRIMKSQTSNVKAIKKALKHLKYDGKITMKSINDKIKELAVVPVVAQPTEEELYLAKVERDVEELNSKLVITQKLNMPSWDIVDGIVNKSNINSYSIWWHTVFYDKMMKTYPDCSYTQIVSFFDEFGVEQREPIRFTVSKSKLTKEDRALLYFKFTENYDHPAIVEFLDVFPTGYCEIKMIVSQKINVSNYTKEAYEQVFRDNNVGTCVYDAFLAYFSPDKSKNHKAIYNRLIKNKDTLAKAYKLDEIKEIAEVCGASVSIDNFIDGTSSKVNECVVNRYNVHLANTKLNHLDLVHVNNKPTKVCKEEFEKIKANESYYVLTMGRLMTTKGDYIIEDSRFQTLFKAWKEKVEYSKYGMPANGISIDFIDTYEYSIHKQFKPVIGGNDSHYEIDMRAAYYNYSNPEYNKHYVGVPSGSFIRMSGAGFTIANFNALKNLIGFFQVRITSSSIEKAGFAVGSTHTLTSPMVKFISQYCEFEFINIMVSPICHVPFDQTLLEEVDKEVNDAGVITNSGIKAYCKIHGLMYTNGNTITTKIKTNNEDKQYFSIINNDSKEMYIDDKNIIHINKTNEHAQTHRHIAVFIHSYTKLIILEQMIKNIDAVVGVKLDSIVYANNDIVEFDDVIFKIKKAKIEKIFECSDVIDEEEKITLITKIETEEIQKTRIRKSFYKYYECIYNRQYMDLISKKEVDNIFETIKYEENGVKLMKEVEKQLIQETYLEIIIKKYECIYNTSKLICTIGADGLKKYSPELISKKEITDDNINEVCNNNCTVQKDVQFFVDHSSEIKFPVQFTKFQCDDVIKFNILMLGGPGGAMKTSGTFNSECFDLKTTLYTAHSWQLIETTASKYKGITHLSIPKILGHLENGVKCEQVNTDYIKTLVLDELTMHTLKTVLELLTKFKHCLIILIGDITFEGIPMQCTMNSKNLYNPSKNDCQYFEYTEVFRFTDKYFKEHMNKFREIMKPILKLGKWECQAKMYEAFLEHFKDNFKTKEEVVYTDKDMGMSFLRDSEYYTNYFLQKGATKKFKYLTTDLRKGITRGMITQEDSKKTTLALFNSCHSMQGQEVNHDGRLIVLVNSRFDPALFYTAASRCHRLDQLIIINEYENRDATDFNEKRDNMLEITNNKEYKKYLESVLENEYTDSNEIGLHKYNKLEQVRNNLIEDQIKLEAEQLKLEAEQLKLKNEEHEKEINRLAILEIRKRLGV